MSTIPPLGPLFSNGDEVVGTRGVCRLANAAAAVNSPTDVFDKPPSPTNLMSNSEDNLKLIVNTVAAICMSSSAAFAFTFPSLDGGKIDLNVWKGRPVLVVNTASLCGFTYQYDGLQALYDRYRKVGLVVLGVPSGDFSQELASEGAVKEFCEVNFSLDIPLTEITHIKGAGAHPFYKSVKAQTGFVPRWNFNKVLLDRDGKVVATFGSNTKPMSRQITSRIERLLAGS